MTEDVPPPSRFDDLMGDAIRLGEYRAGRKKAVKQGCAILSYSVFIIIVATALTLALLSILYGISMTAFFSSNAGLSLQSILVLSPSFVSMTLPSSEPMTLSPSSPGGALGVDVDGQLILSSSDGFSFESQKQFVIPTSKVAVGRSFARYALDINGSSQFDGDVRISGAVIPELIDLTQATVILGNTTSSMLHNSSEFSLAIANLRVNQIEFNNAYLNILTGADVVGTTFTTDGVIIPGQLSTSSVIQAQAGILCSNGLTVSTGGMLLCCLLHV